MSFAQKTIEALARLRTVAGPPEVVRLINTLDDAGVFAALDEQTDYASAEEILAESAAISLSRAGMDIDPAEWGDTTREDMARHPSYPTVPGTYNPHSPGCPSIKHRH